MQATKHYAKPFGPSFETRVFVDDKEIRISAMQTCLTKNNWRVLWFHVRNILAPAVFEAVHSMRNELMEYFDVQSIHFPLYHQFEGSETGWIKIGKCFVFGLVSCTFLISYLKDKYFEVNIAVNSLDNPTFDAISEQLKLQTRIVEEDIVTTDWRTMEYNHKNYLLRRFREQYLEDFKIADFAFQKDFCLKRRTCLDCKLDDSIFSYNYETFYESLCFKANVIPQRLIDEWIGYVM